MDNSAFYPPNSARWSDGPIRSVLRRARRLSNSLVTTGSVQIPQHLHLPAAARHVDFQSSCSTAATITENTNMSLMPHTDTANALHPTTAHTSNSTPAVEPELALRRQRRRESMARYREKQNQRALSLEGDVRLLREQIEKLEVQYKFVPAQMMLTEATTWGVAAEYFRLFRHGVKAHEPSAVSLSLRIQVQRDFLQTTMAPDVRYGVACGVNAHLEVWRWVALYHQDFEIRQERLEHGAGNSLVCTTKCRAIITEDTLRHAFPHLANDGQGNWSPLVANMLGQELVNFASTTFKWNDEGTRVVSVDYKANMLTPLLRLLGNLEDVSHVFDNALVTPEGKLLAVEGTQSSCFGLVD